MSKLGFGLFVLLASACTESALVDGGARDASGSAVEDAADVDASAVDASAVDASVDDASVVDASVVPEIRFLDLAPPALTSARDVTPDGRLALFEAIGDGGLFLVDTETGVAELVATLTSIDRNQALGMSASGQIAAEYGYPVQAAVWSQAGGWRVLGSPFANGCVDTVTSSTTDIAGAWDISADGRSIVGIAYDGCSPTAFLWTEGAGFTPLQVLGVPFDTQPAPPNRATVISDDGSVIAGWAANGPVDRSPAIWKRDGTGFMLDPLDMDAPGEILSISSDGRVAAGIWALEGFLWTEAEGRLPLGRLPDTLPFDGVYPNAMAAGGELIFGTNGNIAFVWTRAAGMRPLLPVLRENGLAVSENIFLTNVLEASADGTVLIGSAMDMSGGPFGTQTGFILRMPLTAYGL